MTHPAADGPTAHDPRIAIAAAYLDALLTHDASAIRFHPRAVRYEAGIKTGYSARHLTASLERGLQYRLLHTIRNTRWSTTTDTVSVNYLLDGRLLRLNFTTQIDETFHIPEHDPQIHRIDARIHVPRISLVR